MDLAEELLVLPAGVTEGRLVTVPYTVVPGGPALAVAPDGLRKLIARVREHTGAR